MDKIIETTTHHLYITGISKEISTAKIERFIKKNITNNMEFNLELIPLEEYNSIDLYLKCTKNQIDSILAVDFNVLNEKNLKMNIIENETFEFEPESTNDARSIINLPEECLMEIFNKLTINKHIILTKVCRKFLNVIIRLWRHKYGKIIRVSHGEMERLHDFYLIFGPYVECLVVNTDIDVALLQTLSPPRGNGSSFLRSARYLVNVKMCRILANFKNVHDVIIQGKNLMDFFIRELARYCKKVQLFRLHDCDTRFVEGNYLYLLENLQTLHVEDCTNIHPNSLKKLFARCKLNILSISKCLLVDTSDFLTDSNVDFSLIQELSVSAKNDDNFINACFKIRNLKVLRFIWLSNFHGFEKILLKNLSEKMADRLCGLHFIREPFFICSRPFLTLNYKQEARKREECAMKSTAWGFYQDDIHFYADCFGKLQNLNEIICEYCRIFQKNELLELATICCNLKTIKLIGCREFADVELLKAWRSSLQCNLIIDGTMTADEIHEIRMSLPPLPGNFLTLPALDKRNIVCCFNTEIN